MTNGDVISGCRALISARDSSRGLAGRLEDGAGRLVRYLDPLRVDPQQAYGVVPCRPGDGDDEIGLLHQLESRLVPAVHLGQVKVRFWIEDRNQVVQGHGQPRADPGQRRREEVRGRLRRERRHHVEDAARVLRGQRADVVRPLADQPQPGEVLDAGRHQQRLIELQPGHDLAVVPHQLQRQLADVAAQPEPAVRVLPLQGVQPQVDA